VRTVPTRKGVTQGFLLVRPPKPPTASLILFAGGDGHLALSPPNTINQLKFNFLVKMRERFANVAASWSPWWTLRQTAATTGISGPRRSTPRT